MPEITVSSAVSSDKGGEYKIYTDMGEYRISAADYRALGLPSLDKQDGYPCCITVDDDLQLDFLAEKLRAVKYLMYLLGFSDKSKKALLIKLKDKEYSERACTEALALVEKNGLVNEAEICSRKVAVYARSKGFGPYRIRQELKAKGFADTAIRQALDDTDVDFEEVLEKLCRKLISRKGITEKNKLFQSLSRYGYGYGDIKQVAGKCLEDVEFSDIDADFSVDF